MEHRFFQKFKSLLQTTGCISAIKLSIDTSKPERSIQHSLHAFLFLQRKSIREGRNCERSNICDSLYSISLPKTPAGFFPSKCHYKTSYPVVVVRKKALRLIPCNRNLIGHICRKTLHLYDPCGFVKKIIAVFLHQICN